MSNLHYKPAHLSLLQELKARREERLRGLFGTWVGPVQYDPYEFNSPMYHLRPWKRFGTYESVWAVWIYSVSFSVVCCCTFHWWPWKVHPDKIPDLSTRETGMTLFQVPLSFLLAFRLQRAAVRFYDSRASAGTMVGGCRLVASKVITACAFSRLHSNSTGALGCISSPNRRSEAGLPTLVTGDESPRQVSTQSLGDDFLRWTIALPVATKDYLRGCTGAPDELFGILDVEDAQKMRAAQQQPLYCLHMLRILAMRICQTNTRYKKSASFHTWILSTLPTL
jgi:predicted membrane chloride channel (bestrophin family)